MACCSAKHARLYGYLMTADTTRVMKTVAYRIRGLLKARLACFFFSFLFSVETESCLCVIVISVSELLHAYGLDG